MEVKKDNNGQKYYNIGNIRITMIEETWEGSPGIRIQAYKENRQLNQGAEIPISDAKTGLELAKAITCASLQIIN